MRYPISFSPALRWLFLLLGARPATAAVEVTSTAVRVRMGWLFSTHVQRSAIRGVHRARDVWWAIGVHTDFRRRWIVNGSARNIVEIDIDPPARAWFILLLPVRAGRLLVSVDDPEALVSTLTP